MKKRKNSGHNGPLFKRPLVPLKRGWISPPGEHFPCETTHNDAALGLLKKFYPTSNWETVAKDYLDDMLLSRGWVRVYAEGYYEVGEFSGGPRSIVLELVAQMPPNDPVVLDIASSYSTEDKLTASQFLDKFQ